MWLKIIIIQFVHYTESSVSELRYISDFFECCCHARILFDIYVEYWFLLFVFFQSAVGFEYAGKTEKHASQKGDVQTRWYVCISRSQLQQLHFNRF